MKRLAESFLHERMDARRSMSEKRSSPGVRLCDWPGRMEPRMDRSVLNESM